MVLSKVARTWRREGAQGLWARLRHPRRTGGVAALTPPAAPPFRLVGGDPVQAAVVADALLRLLGPAALSESENAATIHIMAPDERAVPAPGDILLFADAAAARDFLAVTEPSVFGRCGAVLLPDAALLQPFRQAGIGDGRLFVLGPPDARGLAGGLARWLVAAGALAPGAIDPALFPTLDGLAPRSRLCLGLPESAARRASFLGQGLQGFEIFDGLRLKPGWQGAGWSHATIARAALEREAMPLLVCEDDIAPPPDFAARLATVETYLAGSDWDMFSGLLSDVPDDCRIHHVEQRDGLTFVHLDYATGMVLNIYGRRALERLAAWTPGTGQAETDTVDAWLSRTPGLRAITTLPFLVGHDTEAVSTVFGFANRRYDSLIHASERRLTRLVGEWLNRR